LELWSRGGLFGLTPARIARVTENSLRLEQNGTNALDAATVGQLAATGTAVRVYCSNAANLTGTVPDASIATNTPSASSGMLLAWDKAGRRFWKWVNMLRTSAGTVALDASTAGRLDAKGNVWTNVPGISITAPFWMRPATNAITAWQIRNAAGTSVLNVDTVNSRVGIGTTAPGELLQVNGVNPYIAADANAAGGASGFKLKEAGIDKWSIINRGSIGDYFGIVGDGGIGVDDFFAILQTGNVGIGTTTPTSRLHVNGISQLGTVSNTLWAANQTFPAGQLSANVPYANVTSALARARAPQAVTYSGTNVTTDARLGTLFRINATNDFRLHKPTGAYDGQGFLYWIKQHVGGTNTVTMTSGDFVPPVGASSVVLSVTNGCVDQFVGIWDASINKVRIGSYMRYTE
jgi:hypothetical protein